MICVGVSVYARPGLYAYHIPPPYIGVCVCQARFVELFTHPTQGLAWDVVIPLSWCHEVYPIHYAHLRGSELSTYQQLNWLCC